MEVASCPNLRWVYQQLFFRQKCALSEKKKHMNNQDLPLPARSSSKLTRNTLILLQFFLTIFIFHTLKDLKDSIIITASDAGAEVIPFIKIWGMLPLAIGASFLFAKLYNRFGRETTFYIFVVLLLGSYLLFAFVLYPFSHFFYLESVSVYLKSILPVGCKGLIAMVSYWHYTFFYLMAELWSVMILSILFWGYLNSTMNLEEATKFYPLCNFAGNFAGIISGQVSHAMSYRLSEIISWEATMQLFAIMIAVGGVAIMVINRILSRNDPQPAQTLRSKAAGSSFKDNVAAVFRSTPLLCIALMVVGFAVTGNLIEVVWKENVRSLYPSPQAYNAYINQLTSLIGLAAVCMALVSRWIFQRMSWCTAALITPLMLLFTSGFFFAALLLPQETLSPISAFFAVAPISLVVILGSIHYVLSLTAKYTLFDISKEMAFLSIDKEERLKAKSVIDSIGSRLGKSGASCLFQFLLIAFGSTAGHYSIIGMASIGIISVSIIATARLGGYFEREEGESKPAPDVDVAFA